MAAHQARAGPRQAAHQATRQAANANGQPGRAARVSQFTLWAAAGLLMSGGWITYGRRLDYLWAAAGLLLPWQVATQLHTMPGGFLGQGLAH